MPTPLATLTITRRLPVTEVRRLTEYAEQLGYETLIALLETEIDKALLALTCPPDWNPPSFTEEIPWEPARSLSEPVEDILILDEEIEDMDLREE